MRALFDYDPLEDNLIPCKEIGVLFKHGDILQVSFVSTNTLIISNCLTSVIYLLYRFSIRRIRTGGKRKK